ncbi:MAG: hypothetical protein NTV31_15500 [Bacteroidia bacterium]|nr:hypothetical protein [Bacteroidia bacterium]
MKNSNLYRIHLDKKLLQGVKEIDFSDFKVKERYDIQEWVESNPEILGEELKTGIRIDLCNKFNNWLKENKKNLTCLPEDIGLEVDILTGDVYCHCCKGFVKSSDIKPVPYGKEEAICFVCKECEEVLSTNQIDLILKEYCENGRQLESVDSNSS